jgi:ferric-dicitrate binding protein FerR (iron transport regulator)
MKPEPKHLAYAAALAMLALSLAACAGFDLGDIVKVRTPHDIRTSTGLPRTTSLNDAESHYRAWLENTQRNAADWKASIEQADQTRALLNQLTLSTLNDMGPTVAGLPVVGPALPALTGLAGLFLGAGKLRKEKEASFNKGLEKARQQPA